jgi:hypothetical protein
MKLLQTHHSVVVRAILCRTDGRELTVLPARYGTLFIRKRVNEKHPFRLSKLYVDNLWSPISLLIKVGIF